MNSPLSSWAMNPLRSDTESLQYIHQRYEDTALIIFKQIQKRSEPVNFLSYGKTSKHYAYASYGNAAVIVKKIGRNVTKTDELAIKSSFCVIM